MQNELLNWLMANYGQEVMRPGLERIRLALKNIKPHLEKSRVVTIAGTNGKGETTLRLSQKLEPRTHCVWTSPHIERITERFRNESGEISIELLRELIFECHESVQENKWELSFYEFLFFVFCTWVERQKPEFILLEVGLGGRFDAVNVLDAELVLLPSISRDHQEILGHRYDEILKEKLGVLRKDSTLIHFLESHYLCERAEAGALSIGAKVISLKQMISIPEYEFSYRNELLSRAAFSHLMGEEFSNSHRENSLIPLEHRGESIIKQHEWIFFGSHNVDGVRKLIQFLHSATYNFSRPPYDHVIVAFSRRNLRDLRFMIRMLVKAGIGKVMVTTFDHPKAMSAQDVEFISHEEGSEFVSDIKFFLQELPKNQRVLVTGSYYFMGQFKSLIR